MCTLCTSNLNTIATSQIASPIAEIDIFVGPDGTLFFSPVENSLGQAGVDADVAQEQAQTQPEAGFMSEEEAAAYVAAQPAGTVFIDGLLASWDDISSQAYRTYVYPDGIEYTVVGPMLLNVSDSGSHRVFDDAGHSHWIRGDFTAITWRAKPGKPNFVK